MAQDMDLPGLDLHQLRGKHRGRWSVRVSDNWRITFKSDGHDAIPESWLNQQVQYDLWNAK